MMKAEQQRIEALSAKGASWEIAALEKRVEEVKQASQRATRCSSSEAEEVRRQVEHQVLATHHQPQPQGDGVGEEGWKAGARGCAGIS